jgi:hypothetical protein
LLLCWKEMDFLEVAKLYLEHMFPFVGLPKQVISDCDTRFTSKIFKEVYALLEVKQNIASGYYSQTNRQSEKTNQHIKTALQIFLAITSKMLGAHFYQLYNISSTLEFQTLLDKFHIKYGWDSFPQLINWPTKVTFLL